MKTTKIATKANTSLITIFFSAFTIHVLIACGCLGNEKNESKEQVDSMIVESRSLLITEFYKYVKDHMTEDYVDISTERYVSKLKPNEQLEIARALVKDQTHQLSTFGIVLIVKLGYEDEAVPYLAKRAASGENLLGFSFSWLHADDPSLDHRITYKIGCWLLHNLNTLDKSERLIIEATFRDALGDELEGEFSLKEVLEIWKARVKEILKQSIQSEDQ